MSYSQLIKALKHLAGRHDQKSHGRGNNSTIELSSEDRRFILAGTEDAERAVYGTSNGSRQVIGDVGSVEIPDDALWDVHTHRSEHSEHTPDGYPILSASDVRTALQKTYIHGSYSITALDPKNKKYSKLEITRNDPDYADVALRVTRDSGKFGYWEYWPFWDEAIESGLFKMSQGQLKE